MKFTSIDIGYRNLGIVVEEFDSASLSQLPKKRKGKKRDKNEELETIENLSLQGNILFAARIDISPDGERPINKTLLHLSSVLDEIEEIKGSDLIFIEKQIGFMKASFKNDDAVKVEHHVVSTFLLRGYPPENLIPFPSSNKTKMFFVDKMKQKDRKKWSTVKTLEILTNRGDGKTLDVINKESKKDDICDAFLQLQCAKFITFCL